MDRLTELDYALRLIENGIELLRTKPEAVDMSLTIDKTASRCFSVAKSLLEAKDR